MAGIPNAHRWARRLALVTAGVLVFMLVAWVLSDPVENLTTDWIAFDNAADRLFAGDEVYRPYDAETEPLPYLYPPYALWLALPLGLVGFAGSFLFSALLSGVALVAGLVWLSRSQKGASDGDRTTGLIVGLASGSAVSSTLIGQYSGLYALAIGAASYAHSRQRHTLAGVFLALLWLKPNLAVAVPVVLIWSRSWKTFRGFGIASVLLCISSLPFGLGQWHGFIENAQMMAKLQQDDVVPFHKMVTVLGSIQSIIGLDSSSPLTVVIWLVTALILGLAVLDLWTPTSLAESPVRAFGALALFVVAANPRLYFYDSTLVVVGAFGLWLSLPESTDRLSRKVVPALIALTWLFLWGGLFVSLNRFVGPLAACLLLVSAVDRRFAVKEEGPTGTPQRSEWPMREPANSVEVSTTTRAQHRVQIQGET